MIDAIDVLADLVDLIQDDEYAAPQKVRSEVLAALAYFSNPEDLIPDHIPGLGFLDDAIMVKFIGEEFKHELAGYRKFRKFRRGAEQRPWTRVAQERLPRQLAEHRKKIRARQVGFFNLVDRRRSMHRGMVETPPDDIGPMFRTPIPDSSMVERMSARREPLLSYAPGSAPGRAFANLWEEMRSLLFPTR